MPGGVPEPGWTVEEHHWAVAQFHEGIANGLNPEWPPPRESLMPDGRITAAVYDEGTVGINDLPLNPNPSQDQDVAEARMAPALEVIVAEFMRQVRQQHADPT